MALRVFLRNSACEHDHFGQHQFGHAARVRIGCVEHRDTQRLSGEEIDLVGADAETADCDQSLGFGKHICGQLRARPDADQMGVRDATLELRLRQRLLVELDVRVASRLERLTRAEADAFEQQHLDVLLGKGGFHVRLHDSGFGTMAEAQAIGGTPALDDSRRHWHAARPRSMDPA
jgi:hypothetical protein